MKPVGVLAIVAFVLPAFPQGSVLGRKAPDGKIRFEAVEEIQINGSRQVRLLPPETKIISVNDARHLPKTQLSQIGMMRADATHRIVRLDSSGKMAEVILPENFAPKAATEAGAAQGRLAIEVFQSRKAKKGESEAVSPEEFFAYIPGSEPDRSALDFVTGSAAFLNLGEQLAAMEGFVSSFPASPLKAELRAILQTRIGEGLAAFENGEPYSDLLVTRQYADLGKTAFPQDDALAQLQRQVLQKIEFVQNTQRALRSLAASGDWDLLLQRYLSFERYQSSFPDLMRLRQTAFEETAHAHARRGRLLAARQQHTEALEEIATAFERDPDNPETAKLLESEKVVTSRLEAQRNAASRRILAKDSPEEVRFTRSLFVAEMSIKDKNYAQAEAKIKEAESENPGAPEILVVRALLLAARDRHAEALPLLDSYDRSVTLPAERERGATVRNQVLYELEKKKSAIKQQFEALTKAGEYSQLGAAAIEALKLDPNDDDFLYQGGITAAVLRNDAEARKLLERYLSKSNSLRGDLKNRDRAFRILATLGHGNRPRSEGAPNWFSGRPLPEGILYCPESAAFQLPIESVTGYKLHMNFQWDKGRLYSIASTFDDEKGRENYRELSGAREASGNFYFEYIGAEPQVQFVSALKPEKAAVMPEVRVAHDKDGSARLVDRQGRPRIVLLDHPQINIQALSLLEGPVATGVAGNSFFNPFIWDGIHYFSLTHDKQGRLASAREWNADSLVRFTWSGDRLMKIAAYRKDSAAPYYQRTISYAGRAVESESYALGAKTGRIRYLYAKQEIQVEDGGVHDHRTWKVKIR